MLQIEIIPVNKNYQNRLVQDLNFSIYAYKLTKGVLRKIPGFLLLLFELMVASILWDFYPKLGCHDIQKNVSKNNHPTKPERLVCGLTCRWFDL